MHVRCKFDGGKQINRSQGGSWEGRCAGAGLRQVLGPAWGPEAWQDATGCEANAIFKSTSEMKENQVAKDRKRKASEAAKERRRQTKHKKTNDYNSQQARRDYARHDNGQGVRESASDVPQDYLERMMLDYYKTNVAITDQKALQVELSTRSQGAGENIAGNTWLAERRKRITSSNTGVIAKRRSTTKVGSLVKTLLYSTFKGTVATEWGKLQEPEACKAYLETKRPSSPGICVQPSGLIIHPEHHWLAVSPDGLVSDPASPDPAGIVEFKNPYKQRDMAVRDAAKSKEFCLTVSGDCLRLKRTHQYYYQVQATMFCAKRKWCDFVVRTTVDLHVERIAWDPQFWMSVLPRLHDFYFTAILPELTLPHLHKGGIREPAEWLKDPKAWKQQNMTL